eukprot:9380360-Alexandrium_andersonii.AAC.1
MKPLLLERLETFGTDSGEPKTRDLGPPRSWKAKVKLENAYGTRKDIEAPHSFMFVPRGWIARRHWNTIKQHRSFADSNDPRDVLVLVKQWMADNQLSQEPLLALPLELHGTAVD